MHFSQILEKEITTDAAGDATALIGPINGEILNIIYEKDGSTPYADTVDFNITLETSLQDLWIENDVTASKTVAPFQQCHDTVGSTLTSECRINAVGVPGENVKVVIAAGGNTLKGKFKIIYR